MVSLWRIVQMLEEIAPPSLADPEDAARFEREGNDQVYRVGVCVDTTAENLRRAASLGVEFLLTLHRWNGEEEELVKRRNLSIYRVHSSWHKAPGGGNITLARLLGLDEIHLFEGVAFARADLTLRELLERCQKAFSQNVIPYYGELGAPVSRVAVSAGGGFLPFFGRERQRIREHGCDVLLSGELTRLALVESAMSDLKLIDLGHSSSETPGARHLAEVMAQRLASEAEVFYLSGTYNVNLHTSWLFSPSEQERSPASSLFEEFAGRGPLNTGNGR